jgi:hypothetical protein
MLRIDNSTLHQLQECGCVRLLVTSSPESSQHTSSICHWEIFFRKVAYTRYDVALKMFQTDNSRGRAYIILLIRSHVTIIRFRDIELWRIPTRRGAVQTIIVTA